MVTGFSWSQWAIWSLRWNSELSITTIPGKHLCSPKGVILEILCYMSKKNHVSFKKSVLCSLSSWWIASFTSPEICCFGADHQCSGLWGSHPSETGERPCLLPDRSCGGDITSLVITQNADGTMCKSNLVLPGELPGPSGEASADEEPLGSGGVDRCVERRVCQSQQV